MSIAAAADRAAPAETSPQASARWPLCGALATVALAAPLFALGGWLALDSHPAILFYAVPIVAAELAVIALAIADGFDMRAALARLAPATRAGAAGWLVAIALTNLAIAARPGAPLPLMLTSVVHALFGLALWAMLGSAWAHRRKSFLLAACAGAALYGAVFTAIVAAEFGNPGFNWVGVGIGITNIRQLGFYGVPLAAIALALSCGARGRGAALATVGGAFGFWLTIVSGSRVALAAGLLAMAVIAVLLPKGQRRGLAVRVLAALAVAVPASYLLVPHEAWGLDRILSRGLSGDGIDHYTSGRMAIWRETWAAIVERPLLGHGEGQFRTQVEAGMGAINHPHNALLQFLYQWGVAGTGALALMLWGTGLGLLRLARRAGDGERAAAAALTGLVAIAMLEGALYHAYPVMIVVTCLALLNAGRPEGHRTGGGALAK
ncbi:hypothetical protein GRI72_01800 [Altererythrobacter marinus]|uniref:O-antigen ligase-related domain-containing protein n=1 Tax=Pelagerythrobacter marinus TaxID=538382 RepID=A0ABW9URQ5_9SPHN|nr:O-antigen ligase family protein [Pelagerythrobacter marinus]MXO67564.1 hypothetical protein [Pelagerythrobacter marinus]